METYIGFLSSKKTIVRSKLDDFKYLPVKFILQKKCIEHRDNYYDNRDVSFNHYLIININNEKESAQFGEFRVTEFEPDSGSFYERQRDVLLEEIKTNQTHKLTIPFVSEYNLISDFTDFFELLEIAGTWDSLVLVIKLKEENRSLTKELKNTKHREGLYKKLLEECKSR